MNGLFTVDNIQEINSNIKKIVFLGNSNTFGLWVQADNTFVELVEKDLEGIEAINLAVPGYSSYQGYETFKDKALPLNPDILVVSFNFNDRRYVLHVEDQDSPEYFSRLYNTMQGGWIPRTKAILEHIYIARILNAVLYRIGVLGSTPVQEAVAINKLTPRVSPDDYRANLRRIAEGARQRGIKLIFMLLDDNPTDAEYLHRGIRFLEEGHLDDAIESLRIAVEQRPVGCEWWQLFKNASVDMARLKLVEALTIANRVEEARKYAMLTDILCDMHGGTPIHTAAKYHEIMKEVALEYDAEIIDAAAELAQKPSVYVDWCHFNSEGHRIIATLLTERIEDLLAE